ncbi:MULTISPECIES: hypothetical protein [unclassified Variovorax]|uniref:hypothetical protein n=1 Tax=unclassified Variovorax TaxID=663243 RepID=UPI0011AEE8AB|nr:MULTISPECIES: hypothetical protein [unclassified Variovorax]
MKSDKNGGAGTKSSSSEPWLAAQPWLMQNLAQGQAMQSQMLANPFSSQQDAAYDNQFALSDYGRTLVPSLLDQLGGQPVGFDKNNRSARPKAWDWKATAEGLGQRPIADVTDPVPAPKTDERKFVQQDMGYTPQQQYLLDSGRSPWLMGETQMSLGAGNRGNGSYGAYTYGDTPKPGTQAYRDMQEFFLMGGNDPMNLSQFGVKRFASPGGLMGNSGNSVGGSAAADGSGGGGPGAF